MEEELFWLDIYSKYSQQIPSVLGYPFSVYINYPVFHPAVFPSNKSWSCRDELYTRFCGILVASDENDALRQFTNINEASLNNPANIDAAVCYKKNNAEFWKKNEGLAEEYKNDCRLCSNPLSNGENINYACHITHQKCQGKYMCFICKKTFLS